MDDIASIDSGLDLGTARAYRWVHRGGDVVVVPTEIPRRAPRPGEVRVRITAASLNYRDLLVAGGVGAARPEGPIPLSDGVGVVESVGAGSTVRVGQRVAASFFMDWVSGPFRSDYLTSALGGVHADGVLVESRLFPEHALIAVPDHFTDHEAATLPCAATTAWHGLIVRAGLQADETVLIQGTGGVAIFALQLAVAVGARPIVLSSSDAKLDRVRRMGADVGINYTRHPDWDAEVIAATDGRGANVVLELGGAATYDRSIRSLAPAGRLVQVGVLTGFGQRPDLTRLQSINADIHGVSVGSRRHFAEVADFLADRGIRPVIDRVFPFAEAPAAFDHLRGAGHFGKIVVDVAR